MNERRAEKKHYHNFIVTCLSECVIFYGSSCTHTRFYCTHFFSLPIRRKFCIEIIIDAWHFNWIQFIFYRSHTHTTCCYIGFWRQWKFNKTCFAFMALIHCFSTNSNRVHSFFPATIHFSAILVADSFRLIKGIKWINGQMGIHLTR